VIFRALLLAAFVLQAVHATAADKSIVLASTTSTQNSGLLAKILPVFTAKTGIRVNVVAVGTGQALRIARNGDADVLLVHHRPSEDAFVANGDGLDRRDVMFNDFVVVGPADDPAGVRGQKTARDALRAIALAKQPFASRGDDSGTYKREQELWRAASLVPSGDWYLQTGAGMGTTLNFASAKNTYVLTDRGTWITFHNKGQLAVLFQGDKALFNPYGIILVNPARHPYAKVDLARQFENWIISEEGQRAIGDFRINGFQAFCPDAKGVSAQITDRSVCPVQAPHIAK